ncbi:U6 snRNA phosphodiesterase isoform X1 [Pelobates cultripes]|uniref:U6 snRNA phosphodiesterase 1 n=1 Tax=Pelobates cultripes TaxID=61616 RepID=A0AAD1WU46_PELCU|nr:U6 snRNA phosphodiesterase isoform X1 [Pelobates cultripes]
MGTFHSCWDVQPQEEFLDLLDEVISILKKHDIILNKMNEFHISQSQTVVLRHHWINLFVQSLRDRLSSMHRFLCIAEQLHVYTNSEKTRTFLGLEISVGKEQLLDVVAEVDQSLKEFNLQTFYQLVPAVITVGLIFYPGSFIPCESGLVCGGHGLEDRGLPEGAADRIGWI